MVASPVLTVAWKIASGLTKSICAAAVLNVFETGPLQGGTPVTA